MTRHRALRDFRRPLADGDALDDAVAPRALGLARVPHETTAAKIFVLDVVASSTLTACDAEFVALATALSVPLVTADKGVLKAFPDRALAMETFSGRRRSDA